MNDKNLIASFEVRCVGTQDNKEKIQLVIHGHNALEATVVEGSPLYEHLFDIVKSKISNASKHKSTKPVEKSKSSKKNPATKLKTVEKKTPKKSEGYDDIFEAFNVT